MSNQYEIELIHAANKECDRLQAKLDIAVRALKKIEILIALNLVDKSKISPDRFIHIHIEIEISLFA